MLVHDWTKVAAGIFHDFHHRWIAVLCESLNGKYLPGNYYALAEQVAGNPHPDILTLEEIPADRTTSNRDYDQDVGIGVATALPQVRYSQAAEEAFYANKKDRIAICHVSDDRTVAFIELISPGNKHTAAEVEKFHHKVARMLEAGKHLLMIDVLPPGKHDPRGMHAAFWEYAYGESYGVTAEEPFGCAAYSVEILTDKLPEPMAYPTAYFEPFGRQGPVPTMPLFLTSDRYINVPLDESYTAAWNGVPRRWRKVLET